VEGGGGRTTPGINCFAAEFTKNTGETTLAGGEGRSGDDTIAKKAITFQRTSKTKSLLFLGK